LAAEALITEKTDRGGSYSMEPPDFWRDLQARFMALHDPTHDLHATLGAETWGVASGAAHDHEARESLQGQFRALATIAAIGAGLSGESPFDAWLDCLKQGPHFHPVETATAPADGPGGVDENGWVNALCVASAEYCLVLEATAFAEQKRRKRDEAVVISAGPDRRYKSALGRNVDRFRKECGWSFDDLSNTTKIDKKTILRHVNDGGSAYPRTVKRYADAFSKRLGRAVSTEELEASPTL
jgi:hypothetical protein